MCCILSMITSDSHRTGNIKTNEQEDKLYDHSEFFLRENLCFTQILTEKIQQTFLGFKQRHNALVLNTTDSFIKSSCVKVMLLFLNLQKVFLSVVPPPPVSVC